MTIITQDKSFINYDNVAKIYDTEEADIDNKPVYHLFAILVNSNAFPVLIGIFDSKAELDSIKVKILSKIEDKVFI